MIPPPANAIYPSPAASSDRPLPRRVLIHDSVGVGRIPCGCRASRVFGWRFMNDPGWAKGPSTDQGYPPLETDASHEETHDVESRRRLGARVVATVPDAVIRAGTLHLGTGQAPH